MMETSPTTIAPVLIRKLLTSIFISADKSLLHLSEKFRFLEFPRYLLVSSFLFVLRVLPSLFPSIVHSPEYSYPTKKSPKSDIFSSSFGDNGGGDSGISRALGQLLSIVNDIPVSSRKYEVVRSLAERLIEENHSEGFEELHEVNRTVIAAAFSRTLNQLEATVSGIERRRGVGRGIGGGVGGLIEKNGSLGGIFRAARYVGDVVWTRFVRAREEVTGSGESAEKLAAELLWLGQKLAACGGVEDVISLWASAWKLARLALSAEPRVQGSLVKVSAFMFKQAKEMNAEEVEESTKEKRRETNSKMLISWLPFLCRASNGTDAPILNGGERAEIERALEETIETLEREDQEKVLSSWLHHFTHCPSSDWPNLHACYARWCTASRKSLLLR